jgi:hypothetical protein
MGSSLLCAQTYHEQVRHMKLATQRIQLLGSIEKALQWKYSPCVDFTCFLVFINMEEMDMLLLLFYLHVCFDFDIAYAK